MSDVPLLRRRRVLQPMMIALPTRACVSWHRPPRSPSLTTVTHRYMPRGQASPTKLEKVEAIELPRASAVDRSSTDRSSTGGYSVGGTTIGVYNGPRFSGVS